MRLLGGLFCVAVAAVFCVYGQVVDPHARRFTHDRDVETAFVWRHIPRWDSQVDERYFGYSVPRAYRPRSQPADHNTDLALLPDGRNLRAR